MEQAANRLGLRELVVKRHGMLRRQYVHRNLPLLQKIQRLARHVKALGHSAREHNHFRAVLQQFLHIGNLNTGLVTQFLSRANSIRASRRGKALRLCKARVRRRPQVCPTKRQ